MAEYVDEFRGTDDLYCAEVLYDNNETTGAEGTNGYVTDDVFRLAPVAEISRTTEQASDTKYYDNKPAFTINAEGADTITLNIPALDLPTLAKITGKAIDDATGALMDGEGTPKYFALGYRLGLTDGTYRYVWRYKGSFNIPDESSATKNAGTDSNGQTLTYTGIMTNHKFTKAVDKQGNSTAQKALVVDERDGKANLSGFFNQVTTCDTLEAATPLTLYSVTNTLTHVVNSNAASSAASGSSYMAILSAAEGYAIDSVTVTMGGTDITSTVYAEGNHAIAIPSVTGNIVITATATEQI